MNASEAAPQGPDESSAPTDGAATDQAATDQQDGLAGADAEERFNDAVERRMVVGPESVASPGTTTATEEDEDDPVRPQNS